MEDMAGSWARVEQMLLLGGAAGKAGAEGIGAAGVTEGEGTRAGGAGPGVRAGSGRAEKVRTGAMVGARATAGAEAGQGEEGGVEEGVWAVEPVDLKRWAAVEEQGSLDKA